MRRPAAWVLADAFLARGTRIRRLVVRKLLLAVVVLALAAAIPAVAFGHGGPGDDGQGNLPGPENAWPPGPGGAGGEIDGMKVFYLRGEVVSVDTAAGTITANVVCLN